MLKPKKENLFMDWWIKKDKKIQICKINIFHFWIWKVIHFLHKCPSTFSLFTYIFKRKYYFCKKILFLQENIIFVRKNKSILVQNGFFLFFFFLLKKVRGQICNFIFLLSLLIGYFIYPFLEEFSDNSFI